VVRLAEHRTEAPHLPEQPLDHLQPPPRVVGQELPRLFRQIKQDRPRLENRDRPSAGTVVVDDGRNLVVGADLKELGRELVAPAQVHPDHLIGQPGLLEHEVDFLAIGRGRGI
jgi:hypothetical protein